MSIYVDNGAELLPNVPKFVHDTSKLWYKKNISRDEAILFLKDKPAGTFIIRDSNSFPGAYGMAVKVAQLPPNVPVKGGDLQTELVRHFLIESTPKGVRLKGCSNEPCFGSLAALVYQHSVTPLALPCKLLLNESENTSESVDGLSAAPKSPIKVPIHEAGCTVLFLTSVDLESLTGPEAIAKAIEEIMPTSAKSSAATQPLATTPVHIKVSSDGITITDTKRRLFFRRHFPVSNVSFCGVDPKDRRWNEKTGSIINARMFGFVARKEGSSTDNCCHLFSELDSDQPAASITNFISKVLVDQGRSLQT